MKKIAIIAGDLDPNRLGGAEKHVVETLPILARKNYELHLFVGPKDDIKILYQKYPNIVVHPINYPGIQNLYSLSYILFATPIIFWWLRKNKVNLIWSKEVFPMGQVAGILKMLTGLPLYSTTQNPYCYREEMVFVSKTLPKSLTNLMQNMLKPMVSFAIKRADYMGAVSSYSQKLAYLFGAKHCDVTPNGLEIERFPLRKNHIYKKGAQKIIIVSTSSHIPRNGLDTLIRAFAKLPNKDRFELRLTNKGHLTEELKKLAKDLKIEKYIKWVGVLPADGIPKILAESDIFVRPSRAEGFGVSFIEAMATGVPVVTCPSGGIVDFVIDHETGLLVPPDDPERLAEVITELSGDQALYNKLVVNGRKIVEDRYSWTKIASQIDQIWIKKMKI